MFTISKIQHGSLSQIFEAKSKMSEGGQREEVACMVLLELCVVGGHDE